MNLTCKSDVQPSKNWMMCGEAEPARPEDSGCLLATDIHNDCGADPGPQDKLYACNDFSLGFLFLILLDNDFCMLLEDNLL